MWVMEHNSYLTKRGSYLNVSINRMKRLFEKELFYAQYQLMIIQNNPIYQEWLFYQDIIGSVNICQKIIFLLKGYSLASTIDLKMMIKHITRIPNQESNDFKYLVYYLPHHQAIKETSTRCKLRVVFDASS